jgi:hypothetical protein
MRKTVIDLLGLAKMLREPGVFRIFPNSPFTTMLILCTLHSKNMRSPLKKEREEKKVGLKRNYQPKSCRGISQLSEKILSQCLEITP